VEDITTEDSYQFAQLDGRLPKTWILLDNQSTVNIFYNKALLKDIRTTTRCMHQVRCNAGWMVTNLLGRLPGYPGEVWLVQVTNPDGIANILSLADAEKHFHVRYESEQKKVFIANFGTPSHRCSSNQQPSYPESYNHLKEPQW
jgi:hypothetical protein